MRGNKGARAPVLIVYLTFRDRNSRLVVMISVRVYRLHFLAVGRSLLFAASFLAKSDSAHWHEMLMLCVWYVVAMLMIGIAALPVTIVVQAGLVAQPVRKRNATRPACTGSR